MAGNINCLRRKKRMYPMFFNPSSKEHRDAESRNTYEHLLDRTEEMDFSTSIA